jgi:hypothetical protein
VTDVIDPKTVKRYTDLIEAAERVGQEPLEVLASWGMLRREEQDGHAAMVTLYRTLEAQDIAPIMRAFLNKDAGTAADGFRAVMLWLEKYIDSKEPRRG